MHKSLEKLKTLKQGWDSYDANEFTKECLESAQAVIDVLNPESIKFIIPTSDESVLIDVNIGASILKFEIDSDGEIGVIIKYVQRC